MLKKTPHERQLERRLNRQIDANLEFDRAEHRIKRIGCFVAIAWLISSLITLAFSIGILAGVVAGAYYLATGEYILAP
jgi:hypothetical protein